MDKIFSGKDRAKELGLKNYREMVALFAARNGRTWSGKIDNNPANALYAYVDAGRWIAECECREAFFVEPTEPFAYCARCGNVALGGKARLVIFPDNREEIELALLEREMILPKGAREMATQDIHLHGLFAPKAISRNWQPGESVGDLQEQHNRMKKVIK